MSPIQRYILKIILSTAAVVLSTFLEFSSDSFFRGLEEIPLMFAGLVLFFYLMFFFSDISEAYPLAYKIVHREGDYIQAKVLRFVFPFIPWWMPVAEEYDTVKAQNLFGAKMDMTVSDEIEFKNEEKALAAIEEYKRDAIRERKELFEKPGKKITKYL